MELRETARNILLQRSTADRRAAPEWQGALRDKVTAFKWLDDATAWQMESRQIHGTCQLPREGLFLATDTDACVDNVQANKQMCDIL